MKNTNSKIQKQKVSKTDEYLIKILLTAIGIIPLIVRIMTYNYVSPTIDYSDVYNSGFKGDFFEYNKLAFLKFIVILMIIVFLYKIIKERYNIPYRLEFFGLALLFILVLLSGVLSEFPTIAFKGIHDRHEGTYAYLGYLLLCFMAANIKYEKHHLRYINIALLIVMSVNFITSITHLYGYDLFKYYIVKRVITPIGFGVDIIDPSSFLLTTLANQNYLSGLAGASTGYYLIRLFLSEPGKDLWLNLAGTLISYTCILTSISSSGFITFVLTLPVILFIALLSCKGMKSYRPFIFYLFAIALLFSLIFMIVNNQNPNIYQETIGALSGEKGWKPIEIEREKLEEEINRDDEGFLLPEPHIAPLGGRLFLWKETLRLIAGKPIFGHGLDTLYYYFPNNSMVLYENIGTPLAVVTKPHNNYINLAFSVGIPAMLILFLLLAYVIIRGALYIHGGGLYANKQLLSFLIFLIGIMIQWVVNDSVIGVAVIFWSILGICISLYSQSVNE